MSGASIVRFFSKFALSKRLAIFLTLAATVSCVATYIVVTKQSTDTDTVYWMLNLDLVLLLLMVFVISHQVIRLWVERKRGAAGSRLHIKLVLVFSALAAAPAILMAIFSSIFLYFGVQAWFNDRVSTAVYESLEVAQAYLKEHKQVMRADVLAMANDLNRSSAVISSNKEDFDSYIQTQSYLRNLPEAIVFSADGTVLAKSRMSFTLSVDAIDKSVLEEAHSGEVVLMTGGDDKDRIRALVSLDQLIGAYLYVGRLVDSKVLSHINTAETAVDEYAAIQGKRSQLQVSFTAMFVAVALVLLLAAIWFGLVFAERLMGPIGDLIYASEKASLGDLDVQVKESKSDDEVALLGRAFNRMTSQIKDQRDKLIAVNMVLDERRRFTEAVLSGASSGIMSLDSSGMITLANFKAEHLLKSERDEDFIGRTIFDFVPDTKELFVEAYNNPDKAVTLQIEFAKDNSPRKNLLIRIISEQGGDGAVVTIDDVTDLVSAQRKAAWADVARRIAHEIRNPLTPIQLSAERLKKKYLPQIDQEKETFEKCTDIIIRQVADIGHMVNEFSAYAKMPVAIKKLEDMEDICKDVIFLQQNAHAEVSFSLEVDGEDFSVNCDRSQITQVINNLIQNSADSIEEKESSEMGEITIQIKDSGKNITIVCVDNGIGLPEKHKNNLMEPYVTAKKKGTGLGLAIVKKIIEEHDGSVVIDNSVIKDTVIGAKATIVLPKGNITQNV